MKRRVAIIGVSILLLGIVTVVVSSPIVQPGKPIPYVTTETNKWNYAFYNTTVSLRSGGLNKGWSTTSPWQLNSSNNENIYISSTLISDPINVYFFDSKDFQNYTIVENAVPVLKILNLTTGAYRYSLMSGSYIIAMEPSDKLPGAYVENLAVCEVAETQVTRYKTEYDYGAVEAGAGIIIIGVITLIAGLAIKPKKHSTES